MIVLISHLKAIFAQELELCRILSLKLGRPVTIGTLKVALVLAIGELKQGTVEFESTFPHEAEFFHNNRRLHIVKRLSTIDKAVQPLVLHLFTLA